MIGRIKLVDRKTRLWGYVSPNDGSPDVHFNVEDLDGPAHIGDEVDLDFTEGDRGRHATRIRLLVQPAKAELTPARVKKEPWDELKSWAFVPYNAWFQSSEGRDYNSALETLAALALEERWYFGDTADPRFPFPILDNYLTYTFVKLRREKKVRESSRWAAFNTGLVDRLYDPIFALFERNDRPGMQPWRLYDFCVPGKRAAGRQLTAVFDPLPETARYFNSNFDMLLDTSKEIHIDYEHVILDGISRDRFPPDFLREHIPEKFVWQDLAGLNKFERVEFLHKLSDAVEDDARCMRAIKRRLEDAKVLAEKRTRWNFKTAIPQYYPRLDAMSLLVPLALINDEVVDMALVVTRNQSGSYQGRTILLLDWAYKNARLVCRPDSDWLLPQRVQTQVEAERDDASEDAE